MGELDFRFNRVSSYHECSCIILLICSETYSALEQSTMNEVQQGLWNYFLDSSVYVILHLIELHTQLKFKGRSGV